MGIHYELPQVRNMNDLPLNQILCGDAYEILPSFPESSIDLVITSTPYWGLRNYGFETVRVWDGSHECNHEWNEYQADRVTGGGRRPTQSKYSSQPKGGPEYDNIRTEGFCTKCGAWKGSLGLEPHPQMFINHIVEICRKIKRVMKSSGSFWLNLGDTYFGGKGKPGAATSKETSSRREKGVTLQKGEWEVGTNRPQNTCKQDGKWLQPKQLLGIPWRIAIALQNDGWILRNAVIWYKPNHMPESVKDRLTSAHEFVFFLVKNKFYYFNLDLIRKPHQTEATTKLRDKSLESYNQSYPGGLFSTGFRLEGHLKGKNPGDVWHINTKPFSGTHFAVFPPNLVKPIIKAGCPKNGIIIDPFCGSGTVLKVARNLRRKYIGIEINPEYCKIAEQRIRGRYRSTPENIIPLTEVIGSSPRRVTEDEL